MPDEMKPGDAPEVAGQEQVTEPTADTPPVVSDRGQPLAEQDPEQVEMMRELIDDSTEPTGEESEEGAEESSEEPTQSTAEGEPAGGEKPDEGEEEPGPKTFEFEHKGQTFTMDVTSEMYEALEAQRLSAQQFPHLQGKYAGALEQLANAGAVGQPTEGTVAEQPPQREESIADISSLTSEGYIERFSPLVNHLKESGYFGDDGELADAYPRFATTMALIEFVGIPALTTLERVSGGWEQMAQKAEMEMFFNKLNTTLDDVAGRGEGFDPLNDPKNREKFYGHLQKLGIDPELIFDGDFLAGQWRAFNNDMFTTLENVAKEQGVKKRKRTLSRSAGATGGSNAGPTPTPGEQSTGDEQRDMMRKLLGP